MSRGVPGWLVVGVALLATAPAWAAETGGEAMPMEPAAPSPADVEVFAAATVSTAEALSDAAAEPLRVSMEFEDVNLKEVLKTFSKETGINIIAASDVADQPITLYLEQVTAMDALDQILRAANLTYERLPGSEIYIVKGAAAASAETITRIYQLKYARVSKTVLAKAAARFAKITPYETQLTLEGSSGGSGGGQGGDDVGIDVVVQSLLTRSGSVMVDARTNRLILTDIPGNFPRLEAALAALDVRTAQILVDAEIIETTLSKVKDLGIEWGSTGNVFQFTPAQRRTRFPFSSVDGEIPIALTDPDDLRITLGTLDASKAVGILKAIQTDSDTKILARPKVLTLDNESAVIRLTADEAIGFQTSSQSQTGTTTAEPERAVTGVVLVVTPQVNEHNYITMLVEPTVTKTIASKITAPSGQATPRDPKTRSSRTMVRVRSGDTLVVGGLIDHSEEESLQQVPVLSGIPFIGEAFKNTDVSNSATEVIVFMTPRILDEPSEGQLAAAPQSPLGLREQEPPGRQQEAIEQTLNDLE